MNKRNARDNLFTIYLDYTGIGSEYLRYLYNVLKYVFIPYGTETNTEHTINDINIRRTKLS